MVQWVGCLEVFGSLGICLVTGFDECFICMIWMLRWFDSGDLVV